LRFDSVKDATYVKDRQNGRIVSVAVIVAVGVNGDDRRDLGLDVGPSEAETFWTGFLRKLARRGLRGVKLVISDAHEGIKATVARAAASSPPSSPPPLPRTTPRPPAFSGARSPISYVLNCPSLPLTWMKLRPMCSPT
jgi:hypothetical protein